MAPNFDLFLYLVVLDTSQALDDGYPEEKKKANASSSENQHPRHVRLCWTVWVWVARGDCLQYKDSWPWIKGQIIHISACSACPAENMPRIIIQGIIGWHGQLRFGSQITNNWQQQHVLLQCTMYNTCLMMFVERKQKIRYAHLIERKKY